MNFAVPAFLLSKLRKEGKSWEPVVSAEFSIIDEKANAGIRLVSPSIPSPVGRMDYSLLNSTDRSIKNLVYMLVFKDRTTKEVVHFTTKTQNITIPPGLAKRLTLFDRALDRFMLEETDQWKLNSGFVSALIDVELRVLAFDFLEQSPEDKLIGILRQ